MRIFATAGGMRGRIRNTRRIRWRRIGGFRGRESVALWASPLNLERAFVIFKRMAETSSVLGYERPLQPGTVRIRAAGEGLSIQIAPDTPKRIVLSLLVPTCAAIGGLMVLSFVVITAGWMAVGLPILIATGAVVAYCVYGSVLKGAEPIVITADPKLLRVENAMDELPVRILPVVMIAAVQLRRVAVHTTLYEIEVCMQDIPGQPGGTYSIITSRNQEVLDLIGRRIVAAMKFPEPRGEGMGWAAVAVGVAEAGNL